MMEHFAGSAPEARRTTLDAVMRVYYAHPRHAPTMQWTIGRYVWIDIIKLQYPSERYLFDWTQPVGTAIPLILMGYPVSISDEDPDALRLEASGAQTGPTTRLVCRACRDTLPISAKFCIQCGRAVE